MPIGARRDDPFIIDVHPPVIIRTILLAGAALFLGMSGFLFYGFALLGWSNLAQFGPSLWLLVLVMPSTTVFMLWLAFPGPAALANLQFRPTGVRWVPRRVDRRLSGEQVTEAAITDQSCEILFCHSVYEGMPNGDRIIVRGADGHEQEIRVQFYKEPDSRDCRMITERITAATGLPVRLVIRQQVGGVVNEIPWVPIDPKVNPVTNLVLVTMGALPFVGGVTVGVLQLSAPLIAAAGAALWLAQLFTISVSMRRYQPKVKQSPLLMLATVFTFGPAYGISVILTALLLRSN